MKRNEHESYATGLLSLLSGDQTAIQQLKFVPDPRKSRNAAGAMAAILSQRLAESSSRQPVRITNKTFEWNGGTFNSRNLADRNLLWTNIRRRLAEDMHNRAEKRPAAYLLAFSNPTETTINVWVLPEPVLYESLTRLPVKKEGDEYTYQISAEKQRIEHDPDSPDLTPYYRKITLSKQEALVLSKSREADALLKDNPKDRDAHAATSRTDSALRKIAKRLTTEGEFDPQDISDARERIHASIVRRRGQPDFRRQLLLAYNGKCAITGCDLKPILEAAHIRPYRGTKTNRTCNGLLLRTDLHTLFDLKLIAIDAETMRVLTSPLLDGTCYNEYRGIQIKVPDDPSKRPHRDAIELHRKESRL